MLRRHRNIAASVAGVSAFGWLAMMLGDALILPSICGDLPLLRSVDVFLMSNGIGAVVFTHLMMITAMMPPLVVGFLRSISDTSFPEERMPNIAAFAAGYGAVWAVCGLWVTGTYVVLLVSVDWPVAGLLSLAAALGWHGLPWRQALLNSCHIRRPTSGRGLQGLSACFSHGCKTAMPCIAVCGLPMLFAMSLGPAHTIASLVVAAYLWGERILPPERVQAGVGNFERTARRLHHLVRASLLLLLKSRTTVDV